MTREIDALYSQTIDTLRLLRGSGMPGYQWALESIRVQPMFSLSLVELFSEVKRPIMPSKVFAGYNQNKEELYDHPSGYTIIGNRSFVHAHDSVEWSIKRHIEVLVRKDFEDKWNRLMIRISDV